MGRRQPDDWQTLTKDLTQIPVRDVQQWAALQEALFGKLVSGEKNLGVAVSFDRKDYFFFYDKAGNFRARRLIDSPPWYSVADHVDLRQYFEDWQPLVQEFLLQSGIESGELKFLIDSLFKPDFERSSELTEPFPRRWTDHIIELFGDFVFWRCAGALIYLYSFKD